MKTVWNCLSDPSLHLLGIALLIVVAALGRPRPKDIELVAETPLAVCKKCHTHYFPFRPCRCDPSRDLAHAHP
jgi:hypothetical protein